MPGKTYYVILVKDCGRIRHVSSTVTPSVHTTNQAAVFACEHFKKINDDTREYFIVTVEEKEIE